MPQQCKLLLDNYTGQYTAGSPIQGRIILSLDSDITLRGLRITLSCIEHTEWIATETYYDSEANEHKSRDTQFVGNTEVISIKQWLYGDQHATTNLSVGQHIYPFLINLQQNIPSTYQCEKGSIYYKLTATVDRPMALDYEDEMMIVVYSPIDLNFLARPEDLQPSSYSDEKTVCCWCCAQGPITMDIELAKQTLIPGEHVEVKMRLTNMANINVTGVSFELKQIISYKVTDPSRDDKQESHILIDLKDVGLGAHGENTYIFNVTLPPNVVLPNFAQCSLFSVEYIYTATAKLPSTHTNLEVTMYPKVGHIPLGNRFGPSHYNPHPPIGGGAQPPLGWTNPSAPPLDEKQQTMGYPEKVSGPNEVPPPSYESLNMP
ncbi:arrestin domain-containing protein 3-like [Anthonomus grandis grandis]|uniref:arrestin domain-containing protein 3-like n=1 Tax=Anthonomus grandis grandis TaxID=2921223 RepID=UPI002165770A|nr:arrestin domain-containing protein 3-like [Anthonomus grandis grandis]